MQNPHNLRHSGHSDQTTNTDPPQILPRTGGASTKTLKGNLELMPPKFCTIVAIIALSTLTALAQGHGRDMSDEKNIWDQLQVIAPGALEAFKAATAAMDAGNYPEAVRLYAAVRKKAPRFDPVLRRLGSCLVSVGKVDEGMALVEAIVAQNRTA
jgi:hypothetical protein